VEGSLGGAAPECCHRCIQCRQHCPLQESTAISQEWHGPDPLPIYKPNNSWPLRDHHSQELHVRNNLQQCEGVPVKVSLQGSRPLEIGRRCIVYYLSIKTKMQLKWAQIFKKFSPWGVTNASHHYRSWSNSFCTAYDKHLIHVGQILEIIFALKSAHSWRVSNRSPSFCWFEHRDKRMILNVFIRRKQIST
jgi:hypothetical protein